MKASSLLVLLLLAVPRIASAQAPARSGWFGGAEAGVSMYLNAHLGSPTGTLRLGHSLDRRGIVRFAATLGASAADPPHMTLAGSFELRPLSPRRFTPILAVGGGVLNPILGSDGYDTHGYGFASAGAALRVAGAMSVTLRALVADTYNDKLYSVQVGVEIGR